LLGLVAGLVLGIVAALVAEYVSQHAARRRHEAVIEPEPTPAFVPAPEPEPAPEPVPEAAPVAQAEELPAEEEAEPELEETGPGAASSSSTVTCAIPSCTGSMGCRTRPGSPRSYAARPRFRARSKTPRANPASRCWRQARRRLLRDSSSPHNARSRSSRPCR